MSSRCAVCQVKYDFIGHLETFDDDIRSFFDNIKVDVTLDELYEGIKNLKKVARFTENVGEHFKGDDPDTLSRLTQIYSDDYAAFGYQLPNLTVD